MKDAERVMCLGFSMVDLETLATFLKESNVIETRSFGLLPQFPSQDVSF